MTKVVLVVMISVLCIELISRDFNYSIGRECGKKCKLQQKLASGGLLKT